LKLALYSLAAILLIGLHAGLRSPEAREARTAAPEPVEQVVFVDTAKLLPLHPGWRALEEMRTTLAEVGRTSGGVSLRVAEPQLTRRDASRQDTHPAFGREQLEQEARRAAGIALSRHTADLSEALWLRMSARREAMMEGVQADLMERSRELDASTGVMLKAVEENYSARRLKARLRIGALEVAATSPGIDSANAELNLHRARKELEEIEQACDAEKQRLRDVARARINALRDAEAARIDERLAQIGEQEQRRIENTVAEAQERIATDMDSYQNGVLSVFAEPAEPMAVGLPESISTLTDVPGKGDLRRFEAAVRAVGKQIESDVVRAVRSLARKEGVNVTFARSGDDVPDRTREFEDLMLKYRWTACGPVLSKNRG